jgi:hypothetical protein
MAHIFKHKVNEKLYTLDHLVLDPRHLNGGAFCGIYATPYKHDGKSMSHTKQHVRDGDIERFDPEGYVKQNFEVVGELW